MNEPAAHHRPGEHQHRPRRVRGGGAPGALAARHSARADRGRIRHPRPEPFREFGLAPAGIEGVALASVVPPLTPVLALSKQYLNIEPLVVEPGVRTGMPILYEPPGDVGADRIVNGVAAFAAYGGPVIVVDFGTATTLDVVTRK